MLDIRDNPGGYLTQAVRHRQPVREERRHRARSHEALGRVVNEDRLRGNGGDRRAPLVVLVNGYTSAAAEVLAAALQDNKRAHSGGHADTLGKGSVQVVRELIVRRRAALHGGVLQEPARSRHQRRGRATPTCTVAAGGDAASDAQKRLGLGNRPQSLVQG